MTAKHLTRTKAGKAFLSLVVLALLAVALQSLVFSDASFTARSANPANVFTAGSLSHTNSMADQVVLDASYLRPGLSKTGSLTIAGGGTLTGAYTLSKASLVDTSGISRSLEHADADDPGRDQRHDHAVRGHRGRLLLLFPRQHRNGCDADLQVHPALSGRRRRQRAGRRHHGAQADVHRGSRLEVACRQARHRALRGRAGLRRSRPSSYPACSACSDTSSPADR